MEDIHDLTNAVVVLLTDAFGTLIAVSGDEDEVPKPIRAVLSGKKLAEAGSVRELLSKVEIAGPWPMNISVFPVASGEPDVEKHHVLAICFDAEADLMNVEAVGREAAQMLTEVLAAPI